MKKSEAVSECEDLYRKGNVLKRSDRGGLFTYSYSFFDTSRATLLTVRLGAQIHILPL